MAHAARGYPPAPKQCGQHCVARLLTYLRATMVAHPTDRMLGSLEVEDKRFISCVQCWNSLFHAHRPVARGTQ